MNDVDDYLPYIVENFLCNTIKLFDLVLYDDTEDPQYSAVTTHNHFYAYIQYMKNINPSYQYSSVYELLRNSGYSQEDVDLFQCKIQQEKPYYYGEIFDDTL